MRANPEYGERRELARRIRELRTRLAEAVTDGFLRRHPDWMERYGEVARTRGIEDARFHMDFLAGAVEAGSPAPFADYGRWTAGVLASRGIEPAFLVENLEQIDAALREEFSSPDGIFVARILEAGMEAAREWRGETGEPSSGSNRLRHPPEKSDREARPAGPGRDLSLSRSMYLQAILQGDKRAALTVVEETRHHHPVTSVYRSIVEEAQVEVGALWARNEITVAREHMATAVSQYVLGELYSHLPVPEQTVGRAIITGVEGEQHQLGANMVADLMEAEGWSVRFLGTQMPHRDIVHAAAEHQAGVVGISATMLFNLDSVARLIRELRDQVGGDVRIVVGGRAFRSSPELWREIGADGSGGNLDEALAVVRQLTS